MQQDILGIENHHFGPKYKKLLTSAEAFFDEIIFCNIKEKDFAPQFSDSGSHPNAPVNALVSPIIIIMNSANTILILFSFILNIMIHNDTVI